MMHQLSQSVLPTGFCGLHHNTLMTTTKFGNNHASQNIAKCSSIGWHEISCITQCTVCSKSPSHRWSPHNIQTCNTL